MEKIIFGYDKKVETDDYVILFNSKTGQEFLSGINGKEDPFSLKAPSMLDIGIMGHCYNKCKFCYQGDGDEPNMKLEDFKHIIDNSKDHVMQVALGGRGDPNHHEHFEEIVKYARENGVIPNYTTSGYGLSEKQIKISKEYCGAVAVSMYSYDYTFTALKRLMDEGVKTNIHQLFSYHTYEDVIKIVTGIDVWDGRVDTERLNAVIFLLFKPQGRGTRLNWEPADHQLKLFAELIQDPPCKKFKIGMDSCLVNKIIDHRPLNKMEELFVDTCEAARMSCYITPDMKMMPCSFGTRSEYGVPFKDVAHVWNNSKPFDQFRDILKNKSFTCPLRM